MDNSEILNNIKAAIKSKGMTIAQVATQMPNQKGGRGVSQGALSTILNGNPTLDKLQNIAEIIDIPLSELVSGKSSSLIALIKKGGKCYSASSTDELRRIADIIDNS